MNSSVTTVKKRPLRILTFDGGGFRGIASLVILKALLSRVDPKIKAGEHQPGNYFDLIGGTSTGGLLALMFGRLGMTVKAAIDQYHALAPQIFGKDGGLQDFLRKGARFDSAPFENALAEWLLDQPLIDPEPSTPGHTYCFATTVPSSIRSHATPTLLRSYERSSTEPEDAGGHIWLLREAARATSAAMAYFEPMTVGKDQKYSFKDAGASGVNNPTMVAVFEARQHELFRERAKFCVIVSLGTGLQGLTKKATISKLPAAKIWRQWIPNPARSIIRVKDIVEETFDDLASAATNTENVHQDVCHHYDLDSCYFRFNPTHGLGNFDLADVLRGADLATQTVVYLKVPETVNHLAKCAEQLSHDKLNLPRKLLPQGTIFAAGYINNFMRPLVDMIGMLDADVEPARLCDLVPREKMRAIVGVVVVMPPRQDVKQYNPNENNIKSVIRKFGVEHLVLQSPSSSQMRTVYYAHGFIIDFPRTLNVLSEVATDALIPGQAEEFKTVISGTEMDSPIVTAVVNVVVWERFVEVMLFLRNGRDNGRDHQLDGKLWGELEVMCQP